MPVCPECNDANLKQQEDLNYFVCGKGHGFKLVKAEPCSSCGRIVELTPNGVCPACLRTLSEIPT